MDNGSLDDGRDERLRKIAQEMSDRIDAVRAKARASNLVEFPRGKKRGAKVRKGPRATVHPLRRESVASRYAKLMAIEYDPDDRDGVIAEYMDFATRLQQMGFTHEWLEGMKRSKRERLSRALEALDDI